MTKTIDTLVEDIYAVVNDRGGWDAAVTQFFTEGMRDVAFSRLEEDEEARSPTLRMSNMGTPCKRKLWYNLHAPNEGEALPAQARLKFLYGDILENLLLSLAIAAGHDVRGMQDELEISGIRGHRDCVIDGTTVDVKSASPFSFGKFKRGELADNDPFGYISQLGSYVYAGHREDDTVHPTDGAFLVIDKVSGELCLDRYTFNFEEMDKEREFAETIALTSDVDNPPPRHYEDEQDGYKDRKTGAFRGNGNYYLGLNCSYCEFKKKCWPGLRTFMYKRGSGYAPKYFTYIKKEPKVMEVTDATRDTSSDTSDG